MTATAFPKLVLSVVRWLALASAIAIAGACGSDDDHNDVANLTVVGADGATAIDSVALAKELASLPTQSLSAYEVANLQFTREEEKLARDVYMVLASMYPQPVFDNIADSEQTHTDAVKTLLLRYSVTDPAESTAPGEFYDPVIQALYDALVSQGGASLDDALTVGATIEDMDIRDLMEALEKVDNLDIITVYENLTRGSRNHLRSFVSLLASRGITYVPQYISPTLYEEIINSPMESGRP